MHARTGLNTVFLPGKHSRGYHPS